MSDLREAKQKRYLKNLRWIRQRWKDAKMYASAGGEQVHDGRLFRAVARSAGTSTAYVKQVYHRRDTSRLLLPYLYAAVMGLRAKMGVLEWL